MDAELPADTRDRIGAAIADVLDERAEARNLIALATDLLLDGHDLEAVVDLATAPATSVMSDIEDTFFRMVDALGMPRFPAHPRVLEYLVDHDEIDVILTITTIDEAAAAALRAYRVRSPGADPATGHGWGTDDWWAMSLLTMSSTWSADRDRRRATLDALLTQATTDWEVACVGAGPLEDFVSNDPQDLEWLEERLRTSATYRDALAGAWIYNQVTPANFARLERAAARQLARPST